MNFRKKNSKLFFTLMVIFFLCASYIIIRARNDNPLIIGPEVEVQIQEAFMCKGPDKRGNPTEAIEKFTTDEWNQIFLCIYAIPEKEATLITFWIYNREGLAFSNNSMMRIFDSQYIYFSLQEALENQTTTLYFEYEIENLDFPPGKYSVLLKQGRNPIMTINFELTN